VSAASAQLAIVFHFHQPHYVDEGSGRVLLPWVRLHAVKGYYDVPWVLERRPELRLTLNLTPVLLLQLQRYAGGLGVPDVWEQVARIPPADLSGPERAFLVRNFFSIQPARVRELPRYRELYEKRAPYQEAPERAAEIFSEADLGDLQALFNLAWMGFGARADEPLVRELLERGAGYTQGERESLLDLQRTLAARALEKIRILAASGQVEISTSPLFHPILPLLHDTDVARRVSPDRPPPPRFAHPEDVDFQLERSTGLVERALGVRPVGLWPSEGSVSPEILPAIERAGFRWLASDEDVLLKSLPPARHPRAALYRPYRAEGLSIVFRDRTLSDSIGFQYQHWDPRDAADDFAGRLRRIGAEARARPLVTVVCDGENPWESYPDGGRGFLEGLADRLGAVDGGARALTMSEAVAAAGEPAPLASLGAGSWIRGTFEIWSGKPPKNAAWGLLGRTRAQVSLPDGADLEADDALGKGLRSLAAAEGSDWFWWYDDDFVSAHKDIFDWLFRRHQANALSLAGDARPEHLQASLLGPLERGAWHERQRMRVEPEVDGRISRAFEWEGSSYYAAPALDPLLRARVPPLAGFRYAFDEETLYLRYDYASDPVTEGSGLDVVWRVSFGEEFFVAHPFRGAEGAPLVRRGREGSGRPAGRVAQGEICEIALRREDLEVPAAGEGTLDLEIARNGRALLTLPFLTTLTISVPHPIVLAGVWGA
jgi:alpha-amylase/alpha-mannosidase (GH57 family)